MKKKSILLLTFCLLFSFVSTAYAVTIDVEPESQRVRLGFKAYWTLAVTGQNEFKNVRSDGSSRGWYNYPDGEYMDEWRYDHAAIFVGHGWARYGSTYVYDHWGCTIYEE